MPCAERQIEGALSLCLDNLSFPLIAAILQAVNEIGSRSGRASSGTRLPLPGKEKEHALAVLAVEKTTAGKEKQQRGKKHHALWPDRQIDGQGAVSWPAAVTRVAPLLHTNSKLLS